MLGSTGPRRIASGVTWCSSPISAIHWPTAHVLHAREAAPVEPGQLRSTTDDRGVERAGHPCRLAIARQRFARKPREGSGGPSDAPEWHPSHPKPKVQAHHRQRSRLQYRAESPAAGFHGEWAEPEVALRRCKHRLPANRRVTSPMSGRGRDGSIWP